MSNSGAKRLNPTACFHDAQKGNLTFTNFTGSHIGSTLYSGGLGSNFSLMTSYPKRFQWQCQCLHIKADDGITVSFHILLSRMFNKYSTIQCYKHTVRHVISGQSMWNMKWTKRYWDRLLLK
jgi:hypothetical protein